MTIRLFGVNIRFSFWFFAVVACFLSLGKEHIFYYFVLPVITHELGHFLVMATTGAQVEEVAFTPVSLSIRRRGGKLLSYGGEIAICLGGIAANLLMAIFLYLYTFQSMRGMLLVSCNVAVAVFNLLPVGNLDGGQVLRLLCSRFFSLEAADRISRAISFLLLTPMTVFAVLLLLSRQGNFSLLFVCIYLASTVLLRAE